MALVNEVALDSIPAYMETGSTFHASHLRRTIKMLGLQGGGLVGSGGAVTAQGTPNMSVNVAALEALVVGTQDTAHQGTYLAETFGSKVVNIPASDGSNDRIDRLVIGCFDQEYAGARYAGVLGLVQGTPAGSPVPAAMPTDGSFLELAQIRVVKLSSSIVSGNITDTRIRWDLIPPARSAQASPFTASGRYVGRMTTTGPPASGTWLQGDYGMDSNGLLWYCTAGGTPGTWRPISGPIKLGVTAGSGTGTVSITLPAGFSSWYVEHVARGDSNTYQVGLTARINSDSGGGNYGWQRLYGFATSPTADQSTADSQFSCGWIAAATAPAGIVGHGRLTILPSPFGSRTTLKADINAWNIAGFGSGQLIAGLSTGDYLASAAPTSVQFLVSAGNILASSTFTLWGVP